MFYKYDIVTTEVMGQTRYIVRRRSWFGFGVAKYYDYRAAGDLWKKFTDAFFQRRLLANSYNQFDKDSAELDFSIVSELRLKIDKLRLKEKEKTLKVYGG